MSKTDSARKRFVGAKREKEKPLCGEAAAIEDAALAAKPKKPLNVLLASQVPDAIRSDEALNEAIALLPKNYNFEIHKTVWQVKKHGATRVALQFPEGLLMYSLTICDIVERFAGVETVVMGDVTYGACCIDDFTAKALGCDFMVHYGHSCLVPVTVTTIKTLYVFVEIGIDTTHFVQTVVKNFPSSESYHFILVATIQFISALQSAKRDLEGLGYQCTIPQSKPLSGGEILGCTSPALNISSTSEETIILYLGDGRFHLESIMISNPSLAAYRYDPYPKTFTREYYNHVQMRKLRNTAIENLESLSVSSPSISSVKPLVGIIIGTLGRQGSPAVLRNLHAMVPKNTTSVFILLSEIFPAKLQTIGSKSENPVKAYIQTSCPRLSIDWGHSFGVPLLSPYEAAVAFGKTDAKWRSKKQESVDEGGGGEIYPMDFYSRASKGNWTPNHVEGALEKEQAKEAAKIAAIN